MLICVYNVVGQESNTDLSSFTEAVPFIILNTTLLNTAGLNP